jgi:hypothetical protein
MVTLIKKINQNNHVFFIPHTFSQNIYPLGKCEHFSQVEPFEKPWFVVMMIVNDMVISHKINFTWNGNFMRNFQRRKWMKGLNSGGKHW